MVRVLLINGSPRKYGGTFKLLRVALEGVRDAGGEGEIIHLVDYDIGPCRGCVSDNILSCRYPCVVRDDFNRLGEKMLESDAYVFGTPIYWYGVSGLMKNLIDRMTSFENMIFHTGRSLVEGKNAGFIAVGSDSGSIMAIAYMMVVMNSMGINIPPWALAYHHTPGDPLDDEQAVRDSYNIGYNLVEAARRITPSTVWYRGEVNIEELRAAAAIDAEEMKKKQYPGRAEELGLEKEEKS